MSEYQATVKWCRDGSSFVDNRYSRSHLWLFDGGTEVRALSSPQVVTRVTFHPVVHFATDPRPDESMGRALHTAAHHSCYIANSVKSEVRCEPIFNAEIMSQSS